MPALPSGAIAPEITLSKLGGGKFSLEQARKNGPVLLAFFKVSCPVCQFAFPYLERLYQHVRNKQVTVVGISQDNARDTEAFCSEYGVTFPVALEDTRRYEISNAYGLTNVPTLFLVSSTGTITVSSVGWSRADLDRIAEEIAHTVHASRAPIFHTGEQVPDFRAG
jgi:peroxiredoxin